MSLRLRLMSLVAIGVVASLVFGGAIACLTASRSVQTELRSALRVARQAVENALAALPDVKDSRRELESVIASFRGNRHLRIRLAGSDLPESDLAGAAPPREAASIGEVPAWFVRLIGAEPTRICLPVAGAEGGVSAVVIETDPRNEILEVWNAFGNTVLALSFFCFLTVAQIWFFLGRALRPLGRLGEALRRIERGDYGARVEGRLARELAPLYESFNRMARRLGEVDARNRLLTEELLTLQEQERREIARDLHDEIGSSLFAVNVDAANVARLARSGRVDEIPGVAASIAETVGRMQKQVRSMLGRLRPSGLAEFGLAEALASLVEFWRRRHPEIEYRLAVAPRCEGLGDLLETTIYRIVQESLSNAVRHGRPATIAVSVRRDRGGIVVKVADDGDGESQGDNWEGAAVSGAGFGLLGMAERVRGLGGSFACERGEGGGFTVAATLPWREPETVAGHALGRLAS